jgi:hypothetical protein
MRQQLSPRVSLNYDEMDGWMVMVWIGTKVLRKVFIPSATLILPY